MRLDSTERGTGRFAGADAVRIVGKVAISKALTSPNGVSGVFRFLFALSSTIIRYLFAYSGCGHSVNGDSQREVAGGRRGLAYLRNGTSIVSDVNILVIDDDSASQHALQQVFDTEGWRVSVVPIPSEALRELARGRWSLVVVNVALADLTGPLFATLKTLAQTEADPSRDQKLLRVLFLVPHVAARWAQPVLDREGLPYVMKPFHLHDFLEKVSDLLIEAKAIPQPIRDTRLPAAGKERRQKERRGERRHGQMFASREDYMMTEEEMLDFEKQEEDERKKKQEEEKKRDVL